MILSLCNKKKYCCCQISFLIYSSRAADGLVHSQFLLCAQRPTRLSFNEKLQTTAQLLLLQHSAPFYTKKTALFDNQWDKWRVSFYTDRATDGTILLLSFQACWCIAVVRWKAEICRKETPQTLTCDGSR